MCDGRLEVAGLRNVYHMVRDPESVGLSPLPPASRPTCQTRLVTAKCCSRGLRLAQCVRVRIVLSQGDWMQLDGEPWLQRAPCEVAIAHHGVSAVLHAQ